MRSLRATSSLQRPAVIHLNLVPGFARGATITGASELLAGQVGAQDSHLAVVDTVTHFLYRALGWDAYFRNDFMGYNRANVTTEKQQAGTTSLLVYLVPLTSSNFFHLLWQPQPYPG